MGNDSPLGGGFGYLGTLLGGCAEHPWLCQQIQVYNQMAANAVNPLLRGNPQQQYNLGLLGLYNNQYNPLTQGLGQIPLGQIPLGQLYQSFPRVDAETARSSKERARGLLKSLLTVEQWAEFEAAGAVTEKIEGCEFKLRPGGMIEARKSRLLLPAVAERWCVYPDPYADKNDYMPDEDKLIGQLLHLRAGPDKVRAMANVFLGEIQ